MAKREQITINPRILDSIMRSTPETIAARLYILASMLVEPEKVEMLLMDLISVPVNIATDKSKVN